MRIIAGSLGSRNFIAPKGHRTHPMSEKMRGGLFNALGDVTGLTVLDAFSGSGAIAFEAISRGARAALLIDNSKEAQSAISNNIQSLKLNKATKLVKASLASWLKTTSETFDLVVCDPPYDNLQYDSLEEAAFRTKVNGIVAYSLSPDAELRLNPQFSLLLTKSYGDSKLMIYRRLT